MTVLYVDASSGIGTLIHTSDTVSEEFAGNSHASRLLSFPRQKSLNFEHLVVAVVKLHICPICLPSISSISENR